MGIGKKGSGVKRVLRLNLEIPFFDSVHNKTSYILCIGFTQQVLSVNLYCSDRNTQFVCDFIVFLLVTNEFQNGHFARAQIFISKFRFYPTIAYQLKQLNFRHFIIKVVALLVNRINSIYYLFNTTIQLSNLVSNAFKYSKGDELPKVLVHFREEQTEICVIDYGIGIPEDELFHLFEPFYRATNVKEYSGTGLGTAIAKEYIELIGGSISVKSKLGKGTEFIITLNNQNHGKNSNS